MPNQYQRQNQIIIALALLAVLGVGLWLRLRFIHTIRLYPDEFVTLLAGQMINKKGVPVMPSGLFYDHGLLFSYLGSLAALIGPARLAMRYASLVFGMLTLALTFFIGRRWFSPAVGLIATTGLAVAPAAIHWSGRARMYALLQLLVLLTLWLAYEGLVYNKTHWRWAALLAYLSATLTHFAVVALAPPLVLVALVLRLLRQSKINRSWGGLKSALFSRQHWALWLEVMALMGILAVAFLVKRLGQPKGIAVLEPENALAGLAQVFAIYSDFSFNLLGGWQALAPFYLTLPALIFAPFAIIAIIASFWVLRSLQNKPLNKRLGENGNTLNHSPIPVNTAPFPSLYLTLILLTTTLEMSLLVSPDRRDDKYLFMLLPVLLLLGAQGMAITGHHVSRLVPPISRLSPLLSLISPLLVSGLILITVRPAVQSLLTNLGDDYDGAFAYVRAHWQPGDTILTGTPAAAAFYLGHNDFYCIQRRGGYDYRFLIVNDQPVDRWLGSPAICTEETLYEALTHQPAARSEETLHHTLARHNVWLVLERWGLQKEYYDLPFQQQLLAQTDYVGETQGIFILRSKPDPHPIAFSPAQSAEAVFGDQIRLIGYTLEPEKPSPGQSVRLTLYWQALTPIPHNYTVFVHLRRPGGDTVAQADHRPLGNLYPTTTWPVGETIRETSDLFLSPDLAPDDYEMWVGLYLLETGERLPVQNDTSGENAFKLGGCPCESTTNDQRPVPLFVIGR
ncbi:MAG: glycosyltransferase family 39 protein [Anaerolineae bacterium]|nr:glycosyltransferase family 39 protein [Anaerolineae bacterium]